MMTTLCRISAKNLGAIALPTFCPRCFWLKLKLGNKLPWQNFPGIFSHIDAYTKQVTNHWFTQTGSAPPWLKPFGDLVESIEPPHWSKFSVTDEETGVQLRGVPDHLFRAKDGSFVIIDNKTARFTQGQDALLPLYQIQLNAYAWIAERKGLAPVSKIGLVYIEPQNEMDAGIGQVDGFTMPFKARSIEVCLDSDKLIRPLFRIFRMLHEMTSPPKGRLACMDCKSLSSISSLLTARSP